MLRDMVKANYLPRHVELGTLVSPEEDRIPIRPRPLRRCSTSRCRVPPDQVEEVH
jgi:hypothetical protein